jgi:DNA-directed RNA polymerase specialized sigma24 family protein
MRRKNNDYNLIQLSEATLDIIVQQIIDATMKTSNIDAELQEKKNKLMKEAKEVITLLKNEDSKYQYLLKILQTREQYKKHIDLLNKQLSAKDDVSGDFRKLEEEKKAYIRQREELLTKFYNSSTVAKGGKMNDELEEVFIKVYRNISKFNEESSLYTWIYRITMNTCIDQIKKEKKIIYVSTFFETEDGEIEAQFEDEKQRLDDILENKIRKETLL